MTGEVSAPSTQERARGRILTATALLAVAVLYAFPIDSPDFHWHLATGDWIREHGTLPDGDPFSYASGPSGLRDLVVLRGYWLAQVLYSLVWSAAGGAGIVTLSTATLVGTAALGILVVRGRGCGAGLSVLGVVPFLLDVRLRMHGEIRPQLWTFLFAAGLVYLLERLRPERVRFLGTGVVLGMCVWANFHRGYMLGVGVLGAYSLGWTIEVLRRRATWPETTPRLAVAGLAVLATIVNPSGWDALQAYLSPQSAAYASTHLDGYSTWTFIRGGYFHSWGCAAAAALAGATLLVKRREVGAQHVLLAAALILLAASRARHMVFVALLLPPVLLPYWRAHAARLALRRSAREAAPWLLMLGLLILGGFARRARGNALLGGTAVAPVFPSEAATFIRRERPAGRLFNTYEWGGYLIHALPGYPVFVDGRGMGMSSGEKIQEYGAVLGALPHPTAGVPAWHDVLERHGVGVVVLPRKHEVLGRLRILDALDADAGWRLVHEDELAVVFVRARH